MRAEIKCIPYLSNETIQVLRKLAKPKTAKELQEELGISKPTLYKHLDRLQNLGLIVKEGDYYRAIAEIKQVLVFPRQTIYVLGEVVDMDEVELLCFLTLLFLISTNYISYELSFYLALAFSITRYLLQKFFEMKLKRIASQVSTPANSS
ncbi:MAG: hypothetical protein DRJ64_05285 [Thermoprotei archaeon]|nr:MAG: hypothetical protein DRJ64_05285 [Thermoprotei archaeon]